MEKVQVVFAKPPTCCLQMALNYSAVSPGIIKCFAAFYLFSGIVVERHNFLILICTKYNWLGPTLTEWRSGLIHCNAVLEASLQTRV
jgi:hypothetical protein